MAAPSLSNGLGSGLGSRSQYPRRVLEQNVSQDGVSIVICCHNSASRLPTTLAHLRAQQVPDDVPWEVIVIDNASTDETMTVAKKAWPAHSPVPLRIVLEPKLGLIHARHRGFVEAQYEFVSFIDDDNWVAINWVRVVFEVMRNHPEVGACGGDSDAVCEIAPPAWFTAYSSAYAVGCQGSAPGDVTASRGFLWGAGLTIRRSAWRELSDNGFGSLLSGRRGNALSAGEDAELCFALRLAGWRLWYEPKLRLQHYLPEKRLNWKYLRRLYRGFGASTVGHDPYRFALLDRSNVADDASRQRWLYQSTFALGRVMLQTFKLIVRRVEAPRSNFEGEYGVLWAESQLGRCTELLRRRRAYDHSVRSIHQARWKRITNPCAAQR